jgi:hypothetical protein
MENERNFSLDSNSASEQWTKLPVGTWFFSDDPSCCEQYSVQERTVGGSKLVCSTPWHHDNAKRCMQLIADTHNLPVEQTICEENLADYAKRYWELFTQYRNAWLREMGGVIRPKHWEIDGFVLRMRDIYEKAKLVDRIKQIMVKSLKQKCSAEEMFDEVFKMLAEDRHDQIPTN